MVKKFAIGVVMSLMLCSGANAEYMCKTDYSQSGLSDEQIAQLCEEERIMYEGRDPKPPTKVEDPCFGGPGACKHPD